ncbi:MAG: hypothetical protein JO104_09715 [Candidatus Eremiobacteraeota bacterium]|nr:hypothetical protein [Candidatus Eremiobacteraeota bacterium]
MAAGLLAACTGGLQPPAVTPARAAVFAGASSARDRSWMAPGAKNLDLLYVSDYMSNDVDAYSYPQGKLSGVLRGVLRQFVLPVGLCADASGNIFIPDNSNSTVLEYPHGSTRIEKTLGDPGELPYSCAVDPVTGNLGVVDFESVGGPGGVSIYARARGLPQNYTYGFKYKYYFDAYDDRGNLFVDATDDVPSGPFAFLELSRGGRAFVPITLEKSIRTPGGVGWDGKHVAVGNSRASVIYEFDLKGGVGTMAGATRLGRGRAVSQFLIAGRYVIGANFAGASVMAWRYPAGGAPARKIGGLGQPFGVALSKAVR